MIGLLEDDSPLVSASEAFLEDRQETRRVSPPTRFFRSPGLLKYILDPRRGFHSFFLHFLLCLFAPGVICFDAMFATFEGPLLDWLNIGHGSFGLLYSIPTLFGIVSAPTASLVLRWGAVRVLTFAGIFVFLGCLVVGTGVGSRNFHVVLGGRLVYALFQSMLSSVGSVMTFRIFKNARARAMAHSLIIFFNRVGAISGFFFSGRLLNLAGSVDTAVWLSIIPTGIGLLACLSFAYLHSGTQTARRIRPLMEGAEIVESGVSQISVFSLPVNFWWLFILIGCVYGSILPFETNAVNFFQEAYEIEPTQAGSLLSICPAVALVSPIFAFFVNSPKTQTVAVAISSIFIIGVFLALLISGSSSNVGHLMVALGVGYMMATNVVWVLVPQVVSGKSMQTLAVGVAGTSSSLFVAVGNFFSGYLRQISGDWTAVLLFYLFLGLMALISSIRLWVGWLSGEWGTQIVEARISQERTDPVVERMTPKFNIIETHFSKL